MAAKKKDTGYKKPPAHAQFPKGRSGNPKGRPKGTKNLKTDLLEELQEMIPIREGNQEKRVSKQRAMVKSQVARAVRGDTRAMGLIVQLMFRLILDVATEDERLSPDELSVLDGYKEILLRSIQESADEQSRDSASGLAGRPARKAKRRD